MKSTKEDLKKRGMASAEDCKLAFGLSIEERLQLLWSESPSLRSAAAESLIPDTDLTIMELIKRLSVEKCLYTKIAICETLEKGGPKAAGKMTDYLGCIGRNQHHVLPERVSEKKSFPLPRDIIARTLAKMDITVFPILLDILREQQIHKTREVLDAIGFMVFYHRLLSTSESAAPVIRLAEAADTDEVTRWKAALCLSAFPLPETREVLHKLTQRDDIVGTEAKRSLAFFLV